SLDAELEVDDDTQDELQLALFEELPAGGSKRGVELPPLGEIPPRSPHDERRLSYSTIALFERCSYRYFAERGLGLPPRTPGRNGGGAGSMAATEIGDAVHRLLELVPLDAPAAPPRAELDRLVGSWYPGVSSDELDRVASLVDAYCDSSLAKRVAELRGARP